MLKSTASLATKSVVLQKVLRLYLLTYIIGDFFKASGFFSGSDFLHT